jgi:ADP-heptose:LPS heptosyltransferase
MKLIPWKQNNILVCYGSESPRKQMGAEKWEALVEMLNEKQVGVVQVGRMRDRYLRGAYSLLGLTTPKQLISLARHFSAIVTSDSFVMHAAHLCGVPAVVLWGPTDNKVYGYADQVHLQAKATCEFSGGCIAPGHGNRYATECPQGTNHCMDKLDVETICNSVMKLLQNNHARGM